MILRKITHMNKSKGIVLPATMMRALGWNFGDYVGINLVGQNTLTLTRVPPQKLTDQQIEEAEGIPAIAHD